MLANLDILINFKSKDLIKTMGNCCQARDEKTKEALGLDSPKGDKVEVEVDLKEDLNETAGLEFYLNTSGAVEEDEAFAMRESVDKGSAVAFFQNTLEVNSDTGSGINANQE